MWGATSNLRHLHRKSGHFNPRAPCGARLGSLQHPLKHGQFQSTRPVWGATKVYANLANLVAFQSTRPVWGATTVPVCKGADPGYFNPRAPCGARHGLEIKKSVSASISIHAPRVGRDHNLTSRLNQVGQFQSTRPVWGATANLTILPRQICTKGTKEFLLGRKTHGKKEK